MKLALSFCLLTWSAFAAAQDGTFETSFGEDGIRRLDIEAQSGILATTGDEIYVLNSPFVIKLDSDGWEINDFGDQGWKFISTNQQEFSASDIHAYSSGSILLGGTAILDNGHQAMCIQKRWGNGSLNGQFGNFGEAIIVHPEFENMRCTDIFKCDDGSILACGRASNQEENDEQRKVIVRLLPNGQIDPQFANDGIFTGSPNGTYNDVIEVGDRVVASQFYVDIIVDEWGNTYGNVYSGGVILNYYGGGIAGFSAEGGIYDWWLCLEPYDDESIVVGGQYENEYPPPGLIRMLDTDGHNIDTFGDDGYVQDQNEEVYIFYSDLHVQADGKVLAASESPRNFYLKRYMPNGEADPDFGTAGTFSYSTEFSTYRGRSICMLDDESIIYSAQEYVTDSLGEVISNSLVLAKLQNGFAPLSQEHFNIPEISISPNPSSDYINLSCGKDPIIKIEILNTAGAVCLTAFNKWSAVDIRSLKPGTYLLRITTDQGVFTEKLMIVR